MNGGIQRTVANSDIENRKVSCEILACDAANHQAKCWFNNLLIIYDTSFCSSSKGGLQM